MDDFRKEARGLSTSDIIMILKDQADLYTEEEFAILKEELASRPSDALEKEEKERIKREKQEDEKAAKIERDQEIQRQKKAFDDRLRKLRENGYEGYYKYTTLSLIDSDGGYLSPEQITQLLNDYALDGWHLVSAYTNELGHKSTSGGIGGFSTGTNSTVDQHILIMEKFIKIV